MADDNNPAADAAKGNSAGNDQSTGEKHAKGKTTATAAKTKTESGTGAASGQETAGEHGAGDAKNLELDQAREILRKGTNTKLPEERDPLLSASEELDPLMTGGDGSGDPLGHGNGELDPAAEAGGEGEVPDDEGEAGGEGNEAAGGEAGGEEGSADAGDEHADGAEGTEGAGGEESKPQGRKRLNIFRKDGSGKFVYGERERAIMQLSDESQISLREAETRLFGEGKQSGGDSKQGNETADAGKDPIAEATAKIAELKAKRAAALEALTMKEALKLEDEIDAEKDKLRDLNQRREREQSHAQGERARSVEASMGRAMELFADAGKAGTPLYSAIEQDIARLQGTNPAFFSDHEWPETLAAKHAVRLGISPSKPKTGEQNPPAKPVAKAAVKPAVAKPAVVPVPKSIARQAPPAPGSGNSGAPPANAASSDAQISARIEQMKEKGDEEGIRNLLREKAA